MLPSAQVTRLQLLAVGEADLLDALGLTKITWTARDKRTLTSMYYKQDKYVYVFVKTMELVLILMAPPGGGGIAVNWHSVVLSAAVGCAAHAWLELCLLQAIGVVLEGSAHLGAAVFTSQIYIAVC